MKRPERACCYCGETLPRANDGLFTLRMGEPGDAPVVVLVWHAGLGGKQCASIDPKHLDLADALGLPDGQEHEDAVARAYLRLLDRIGAERGADGLRAAVNVKRDTNDPGVTLRGPGLMWGRRW